MSLLTTNTTPAERARKCTFAELFEDPQSVIENGGEITGAEVCNGATFDGDDHIQYDLTGNEFNNDEISIVLDFSPDFADDDGLDHYIYDTIFISFWLTRFNPGSSR